MLKMPLKQNLLAICFLWKPSSPTSAGRATSSAREKPPGTSSVFQILHGPKLHLLAKVSVCSFGLFTLVIWQNYYWMKTLSVICCCADHRVGDTGGCSGCPAWHVPGLFCDTQTPLICFPATRFSVLYLPPMPSSPLNLWKKSLWHREPLAPSKGRLQLQRPLQIPCPQEHPGKVLRHI